MDTDSEQVTAKHISEKSSAPICEEDHKLATVGSIRRSGPRGWDCVQNRIVHFEYLFTIFFSLQSKLYILSYTLSFHELIEFKADEDRELGTVSGKKKTFLIFFLFFRSSQQHVHRDHEDVWLSFKVLPLQLDVKHR